MTSQFYEYDGGVELDLVGELVGWDGDDTPIYVSLTLDSIGEGGAPPPFAPFAPGLSVAMPSRTSATVTVTLAANEGRPAVTDVAIYRSMDGGAFSLVHTIDVEGGDPLVWLDSPLGVNTPEREWRYYAVAVNVDGNSPASNIVLVQWQATPTNPPTAVTGLARGVMTPTSVPFTWAEVTDATVTKHGVFDFGILIRDNISAAARSYTLTGLSPSSSHSIDVRRANPDGWSPASNVVTFTTPADVPVTPQAIVLGCDILGDEPRYFTDWRAGRVYRENDCVQAFNAGANQIIAVTDDPAWSRSGGATTANRVRNVLIDFYEGSGSAARQNCEIHVANGNEVDAEYQSGSLPTNVITTYQAIYNVVMEMSGSVRRFPKASAWTDMTTFNLRTRGSGPRFKPIAPYIHGLAGSFYPTGRDQDPVVWTTYSAYMDIFWTTLADWRTLNPAISMMAVWETGSPIDHAQDTGGPNNMGTTNWNIRPRYFAGGRVGTTNYEGFLNYFYRKCVENNVTGKEVLYWNQQSNANIPNPWKHDRNPTAQTVSIDTVTALHNWTTGSALPNA